MLAKVVTVLISGKAGVGKSTLAKMLAGKLGPSQAIIVPFAIGVKKVATSMGWNGEKDEKGRRLLQGIGAIGREYDQDMWVKKSYDQVLNYVTEYGVSYIITDDWRFPNEVEAVRRYPHLQVFTINISAPEREILKDTPAYYDVSETSLPQPGDPLYDIQLYNNGTMHEFNIESDKVVQYIMSHAKVW